jgi:hypothetical protein
MIRKCIKPALLALIAGALAGCAAGNSILPSAGAPTRLAVLKGSGYPGYMAIAFLMTDGSVVAQSGLSSGTWYRLTPDNAGDYSKGTWAKIASLQSGYVPSAFASQVLADGRLVITGGEYNSGGFTLTNKGAVYDPVANAWTPLGHPHGWGWIGDSPSSMLPDGRLLLGQKLTKRDATLDPKTLKWTSAGDTGKADFNAEEGWTLLPDGTILTVDVKDTLNSEIYNPATGTWKSAGSTIVKLGVPWPPSSSGCLRYGPNPKDCYYPPGEIGPAILRPDGTVFYTGAALGASGHVAGHTAIYHTRGTKAGTWTVGPDFPHFDSAGDSWALLQPSGKVLVFGVSGTAYDWDGSSLTSIGGLSYGGPPLLLPTGQVLMLGQRLVLYTPSGSPKASWLPKITAYPKSVAPGKTYKIVGTHFNGFSQAMSVGDEFQNATNYPLVRITNTASGRVYYARTHDHSTMGVATGSKRVWTFFDVPKGIATGASTLEVVANGIASKPVEVTVAGPRLR